MGLSFCVKTAPYAKLDASVVSSMSLDIKDFLTLSNASLASKFRVIGTRDDFFFEILTSSPLKNDDKGLANFS